MCSANCRNFIASTVSRSEFRVESPSSGRKSAEKINRAMIPQCSKSLHKTESNRGMLLIHGSRSLDTDQELKRRVETYHSAPYRPSHHTSTLRCMVRTVKWYGQQWETPSNRGPAIGRTPSNRIPVDNKEVRTEKCLGHFGTSLFVKLFPYIASSTYDFRVSS